MAWVGLSPVHKCFWVKQNPLNLSIESNYLANWKDRIPIQLYVPVSAFILIYEVIKSKKYKKKTQNTWEAIW